MNKVPLDKIIPDKDQPRKYFAADKMKNLKDSVKKYGIVNPLIVEKKGDKYLLIDGERRYRTAVDLKLKEVPIAIVESKDPVMRMIEQFHIQEQHEAWSPTEKAMVLIDLCSAVKKPLKEICELLSISDRTASAYLAFGRIQNKEQFINLRVNLLEAESINAIKAHAKRLTENELNQPFSKTDERQLEKQILERVGKGEISSGKSKYTQLKDIFTANPKLIEKFMKGESTVSEMFVKSKAKAAYAMRNISNHANFMSQHISKFLENPDVKMDYATKVNLKRVNKMIKDLLDMAGDE